MSCLLCHDSHRTLGGEFPQMVCERCDQRAINANGETPWTGYPPENGGEIDDSDAQPPDEGENLVFIDGKMLATLPLSARGSQSQPHSKHLCRE